MTPQDDLERLLGPEGPELTCEECFDRLDEHVEHGGIQGMDAHLAGCPACREDYDSLRALVDEG